MDRQYSESFQASGSYLKDAASQLTIDDRYKNHSPKNQANSKHNPPNRSFSSQFAGQRKLRREKSSIRLLIKRDSQIKSPVFREDSELLSTIDSLEASQRELIRFYRFKPLITCLAQLLVALTSIQLIAVFINSQEISAQDVCQPINQLQKEQSSIILKMASYLTEQLTSLTYLLPRLMVEILVCIKYLQHLAGYSQNLLESSKTLAGAVSTYISRGNTDYQDELKERAASERPVNQFTQPRKQSLKIDNIRFSKMDSLDDSLASKSPTAIREELSFNVRDARDCNHAKNLMMMRRNTLESPQSPLLRLPLSQIISEKSMNIDNDMPYEPRREESSFQELGDSIIEPRNQTQQNPYQAHVPFMPRNIMPLQQMISEQSEEVKGEDSDIQRSNGGSRAQQQQNQSRHRRSMSTESFGGQNLRSRIQPKQCGGGKPSNDMTLQNLEIGQRPTSLNRTPILSITNTGSRTGQVNALEQPGPERLNPTEQQREQANQRVDNKKLRGIREVESLKAKVRKLQKQLMNNKIFLNMVIHDMRNPTNSIEFALKEVLRIVSGQGAPDPVAAAGAPVRTHSENFRLVAVASFDSLKDQRQPPQTYQQPPPQPHLRFSFFGGGANQKLEDPDNNFFGSNKSSELKPPQAMINFRKVSRINQNAQLRIESAKFPEQDLPSPCKDHHQGMVFFKDSVNSPIPDEHLGQASLPAMKVKECFEHMADDGPKEVDQQFGLRHMDSWRGPAATTKITHRVFINLPLNLTEALNVPNCLQEFNQSNHNPLASFPNLFQSNLGQHGASSGISQRFGASDIIPEEYVKDDSLRKQQLTGQVKVREPLRKDQTFGGLNTPKIWSIPSVTENFGARIGTLVNATSHILSGLQNQCSGLELNQQISQAQQALMLELESLMVQLHETGIILSQQKKVELECLLKNSVFGSTMILNLINDLLDLAKIESSTFKLNWTYFNLFDLIARSTETLDCQLASKRIMVSHEYKESDRDYLLFINGDSHRYFQILLNFMSNAVKFTPMDGSIKIQTILKDFQRVKRRQGNNKNLLEITGNAKKQNSGDMNASLHSHSSIGKSQLCYINFEIRIKDSGIGIAKENLGKLFMNFSRLEEHQKMNHGGTGLGLSICKSLIELMGGSVSVESELGQGTTFIVSLKTKCKLPQHGGSHISSVGNVSQYTSNNNLRGGCHSMTPVMANCELRVMSPTNNMGTDGVKNYSFAHAAQENSATRSPKVAPETLMNRVRNNAEKNQMIKRGFDKTNYSLDNYRLMHHNQEEAKMPNKFLTFMRQMNTFKLPHHKSPIDQRESGTSLNGLQGFSQHVMSAIDGYRSVQRDARTPSPYIGRQDPGAFNSVQIDNVVSAQKKPRKLYRILVANDDSFQLRIILHTLHSLGVFLADEAENGLVAVDKARGTTYEAIILDLDMPIMTGYEACQKIRGEGNGMGGDIHDLLHIDQKYMDFDKIDNSISIFNLQKATCVRPFIVALSALVTDDVKTRCLECGFDDVIQSPLSLHIVQSRILPALDRLYTQQIAELDESDALSEHNGAGDTEQFFNVFNPQSPSPASRFRNNRLAGFRR